MRIKKLLIWLIAAILMMSMMIFPAFAADSDSALQKVIDYNYLQHNGARKDATALASCSETPRTYDGSWIFIGNMRFSYDDPASALNQIANKVTFFCKTDREKANAIHDWIAEHIAYDVDSAENKTITAKKEQPLTVYYEETGTCGGYANLMTAMLREVGVPAKTISGYALGELDNELTNWTEEIFDENGKPLLKSNHTWMEAYYENDWHIYDPTWDSSNRYKDGKWTFHKPINKYRDISIEDFSKTHLILRNGDERIPSSKGYELLQESLKEGLKSENTLEKVQKWNKKKHDQARDDSTALAVYAETASTNTGSWEVGDSSKIAYSDPDGNIAALSKQLTADCNTDKEKADAIHHWITKNIYYDNDLLAVKDSPPEASQAAIVLNRKRGICVGYANLMTAFLREAGIPAKTVSGYTIDEKDAGKWPAGLFGEDKDAILVNNHAWVEAYFDGSWHSYDPTWDSFNTYQNGKATKRPPESDFCDISLEKLSQTHYIMDNCDDYLPTRTAYRQRKTEIENEKRAKKLEQKLDALPDAQKYDCLIGQPIEVIQHLSDSYKEFLRKEEWGAERAVKQICVPIQINGSPVTLETYYIDGNYYARISDIACCFFGKEYKFNVYKEDNALYLQSDSLYEPGVDDQRTDRKAYSTGRYRTPVVYKDGERIHLSCYTMGSADYYKIRDIGRIFDFRVSWDGTTIDIHLCSVLKKN